MKSESLKTRLFRQAMNVYPMYFGTGGKVTFIQADWQRVEIRLGLNLRTRNYVGTIFGGSQFGAVDPFHVVMLLNRLGKGYVVWDKSASIRFRKPGKGVLAAQIEFSDEEILAIEREAGTTGKHEFVKSVEWKDSSGDVVSIIEKTIYVATKEYTRARAARRAASGN